MPGGRPSNRTSVLEPHSHALPMQAVAQLDLTLQQLHVDVTISKGATLLWLAKYGFIANDRKCDSCGERMKLYECYKRGDGFEWRCRECQIKSSIRKGSFFENSKLPLPKLVNLLYWWTTNSYQYTVIHETGISKKK